VVKARGGEELTEAIKKVNQQGFDRLRITEKLTTLLHKSGYDITLGDDNTLIIGDNNQGMERRIKRLCENCKQNIPIDIIG